MNRTQKKRLFQGLLAMGIVLLVLSLLLDGRVPDSLGGMLCGIGSGLLAMAGSTLLNLRHEAKHPEMARQHDIEQKDERNVAIRNRAKAVSGEVLQWSVLAAAWLSIGLDAPLWVPLAATGVFVAKSVLELYLMIRYEREMGVKVSLGHNADNVVGADMVVYSAAISKDNVELNAAASYGIPTVERSVLLGYVSRLYKQSICVSGTHGKTTTTSMITTALELAGRDPSAVIGGKLPLINGYGKAGKGDDIVIESCEFAETFLKLTPYLSVVLNIDNDHLDYYGSMGELKFAFKRFALMTKFMIFANADDKNTMDVMYTLDRRVRTFGIQNDGDYQALNVNEYKPGFFEFDLKEWNKVTGHIRLAVPGYHNIYNALAMCAVCRFIGLTVEQCADAALNFKGAGRRFEVYGECNGALVVDDYAHHPTELRATLNTAKEMGYKRLIAVHQPFTYSRTKMLFNDFVDVLKIPDVAVITPIMGSREPNDPTITSAKLAAQIPGSVLVDSLEAAADWVKQNAREGDLVITLGCGDIYKASKMMVADNNK